MASGPTRVQLIQKLPNNKTYNLFVDLPAGGVKIEYFLHLHSTTKSKTDIPDVFYVDTDQETGGYAAASLTCQSDWVILTRIRSGIYLRGANWKENFESPKQCQSHSSHLIQLRQNDIFFVGDIEMSIHLIDTTPAASGSSPQSKLERGATVEETPYKDPHLTPTRDSARIMNAITGIAMTGKEDSQNWPADTLKRATLSSIQETERLSQSSSTSVNEYEPLPATHVTPSKVIDQDSLDPKDRKTSLSQWSDPQRSESPANRVDEDTQAKDDTQASNIRHADNLLNIAEYEQPSSSIKENASDALISATTHEADRFNSKPDRVMPTLEVAKLTTSTFTDSGAPTEDERLRNQDDLATQDDIDDDDVEESDISRNHLTPFNRAQMESNTRETSQRSAKRVKFLTDDEKIDSKGFSISTPEDDETTDEASPKAFVESVSSNRSIKSTARKASSTKIKHSASDIRVLFASSTIIDQSKVSMKFLTAHGVQKVTTIQDCTVLCVGKNAELRRTSNLVLAILDGKSVITDNWVSESVKAKKILDMQDYQATDPPREEEWGTSLIDAVARGQEGLEPFTGWSFCFTPAIKKELGKGFNDLKEICLKAGAKSIQATMPRKGPQEPCRTLIIAAHGDKDLGNLHQNGWVVHGKEIITLSILRGSLQSETEEFLIESKSPSQSSKGKKRKR